MATAALVNPFSGHAFHDQLAPVGKRASLIGGIFKEVALALHAGGGFGSVLMDAAFDEELLKRIYDAALVEAGVTVLYHTYLTGVRMSASSGIGRIAEITTISKGGGGRFRRMCLSIVRATATWPRWPDARSAWGARAMDSRRR